MNFENDPGQRGDLPPRVAGALWILLVLTGLFFCFVGRGNVHLFGDEFHSVWNLDKPYTELIKTYDPSGSGTALPMIQRFACQVFGPGLFAYRFPAILGAMACLLMSYAAARRLMGRVPALIASFALATNGLHIFYARFGRSYALTVFAAVLLVYGLERILDRECARKRWYPLVALSAGLLPFLHLTSIAFVVAVGAAAIVFQLIDRETRRQWHCLAGSLAVGGAICLLLYLPAWTPLWQFINEKLDDTIGATVGLWDLTALMAGSHTAALVWMIALPIGAIWFAVRKRSRALVFLTAIFAPAVILSVVQPYGKIYAYVRYLLCSLPFMLMLIAWVITGLLRALIPAFRRSNLLTLAAGLALVIVSFAAGPLGVRHTDDGPFANSYLSMTPLPAFDVPWNRSPAFYKTLADSPDRLKIIEAPELPSKAVLLYRNYYLQHRKEVEIGMLGIHPSVMPRGPYRSLIHIRGVKKSDADYLIVHRDIEKEVGRYWRFVFDEVWPEKQNTRDTSFMEVHAGQPDSLDHHMQELSVIAADWIEQAKSVLGEPVYEDEDIAVWKLNE